MEITYFTIYGERCSGTNFVRKLIFDNFNLYFASLPEKKDAGWKHFFGTPENVECIKKSQGWCFVIAIVRNPIDYFVSFFNNPHHQSDERTRDFKTFLTSEFFSVNKRGEVMCDRNLNDLTKRYKDIFEMRATKLRWMHSVLPTLTTDCVLVRHEDLRDNTEAILSEWATKFKLERLSDQWVIERRRVSPQGVGWFRFVLSDKPMPDSYTIDDPEIKAIIRERLDFEAEALVGYDKESILRRLE